jgi:hypothetical protein
LLRRLTLVLSVEAVALLLLGLGYGGYSLSKSGDHAPAVLAAAAAVVAGLVLGGLARAVGQAKAWARTPVVVLNIFPLPIAIDALQGGAWWVGVPLLLVGATVLYLFATPELRERFRDHPR